jgi:glutathione S-transferase
MGVLETHILGRGHDFLSGDQPTQADYVGVEMVILGEMVGSTFADYPNIRAWLGRMKALPHWADTHTAYDGFAASLAGREFVTV